jgi:hypothetical protein
MDGFLYPPVAAGVSLSSLVAGGAGIWLVVSNLMLLVGPASSLVVVPEPLPLP